MRTKNVRRGFLLLLAAVALVFPYRTIHAYSIYDTPTSTSSTFGGGILSPFENFFQSVGSINTTSLNISIPTGTTMEVLTEAGQTAWNRFDAWLYGIAGFHISNFFSQLLTIWSWILGTVKSGIDSLIKIFGN